MRPVSDFPVTPVTSITQERLKRVRLIERVYLRAMTALYRDLEACGSIVEPGRLSIESRFLRHRIVESENEVVELAS